MKRVLKRSGIILLLASLLAWSGPAAAQDALIYNPATKHYYGLTPNPGIWTDAQTQAQAMGGNLATVNNQAENDWLVNNLVNNLGDPYAWIGLYQTDKSSEPGGNWAWVNGEPLDYTNWSPGEPNNFGGNEDWGRSFYNYSLEQWCWEDAQNAGSYYGVVEINAIPNIYSFRFDYNNGNGDSYTGYFYANSDQGYDSDWTQAVTDENGNPGLYSITGVQEGAGDLTKAGQVFVDSYYDSETRLTLTPLGSGTAAGTGDPGTETGSILQEDGFHRFGQSGLTFYEADALLYFADNFDEGASPLWGGEVGSWAVTEGLYGDQSNNPYSYSSLPFDIRNYTVDVDVTNVQSVGLWLRSDYDGLYDGVILVANIGYGSTGALHWHTYNDSVTGDCLDVVDQGWELGVADPHVRVEVNGDNYTAYSYDADGAPTAATTLVTDAFASGRVALYDHLGQAFDNFVLSNLARYEFTYHYGVADGEGYDSYHGYVYAPEGVYAVGTIEGFTDENGVTGNYYIDSWQWATAEEANAQLNAQVFVDSYFDMESGYTYYADPEEGQRPLVAGLPAGTDYLGSESGYISQAGVTEFLFGLTPGTGGPTLHEADLGIAYSFTYNYGGGEYVTQLLSEQSFYDIKVNAAGWAVCRGYDGDNEIYLYTGSGDPINITNNEYEDAFPQINDLGQAVWYGYDPVTGQNQIFLYTYDADGGTTQKISSNTFGANNPQINNAGQVVWQGNDIDVYDSDIFLYTPGQDLQTLTDNTTYYDWNPQLNDAGQVVWQGLVNYDRFQIFLYTPGGEGNQQLSQTFEAYTPQINNSGQVVWYGYDPAGTNYEIFLYTPGEETPNQLTSNTYYDWYPQINDAGQVAWSMSEDPRWSDSEVFLYTPGGGSRQLTDNGYNDNTPQINNAGQVVWWEQGANGSGIYLYTGSGDPITISEGLTNIWGSVISDNGVVFWICDSGMYQAAPQPTDYYSGTVYASPDYGYSPGWRSEPITDENGVTGYYTVTSQTGFVDDADQFGQVLVSSYYDQEYGNSYIPLKYAQAVPAAAGAEYLGSESDYIIQDGPQSLRFGFVAGEYETPDIFYEADVTARYSFEFNYTGESGGDSYQGFFYGHEQYAGNGDQLTWEGLPGVYTITSKEYMDLEEGQILGQVYVSSYYDHESDRSITPLTYNQEPQQPAGAEYLGSENDSIIQTGIDPFRFGNYGESGFLEADVLTSYDFTFTYDSGDNYAGVVYAPPDLGDAGAPPVPPAAGFYGNGDGEAGYYVGRTWDTALGTYEITAMNFLESAEGYVEGLVWVNRYSDAESGLSFAPVGSDEPLGTDYLGSESGYIISEEVPQYFFDGDLQEADLVTGRVNTFRFTYANGDYYTGTVRSDPAAARYYLGYTQEATDENGQTGVYEITGTALGVVKDSKKYGRVLVDSYFDAESGNTYDPKKVAGNDYLGSEGGYIVKNNVDYLRFGAYDGNHWEADVAALYAFAFNYGNGDKYLGTVTAMAGTYQVGAKMYQDDETTPQTGNQGYYHITGVTYPGNAKTLEQVAVKNYYDQESTRWYRIAGEPGTNGLRSEFYWIIGRGIDPWFFGGGFFEADVKQDK